VSQALSNKTHAFKTYPFVNN